MKASTALGQPRLASHDLTGVCARMIATAFEPMPVVAWLVPEEAQRREVMTRYFRILVEHAIANGRVEVLSSHEAVAVWLRAGDPNAPEIDAYERRRAFAVGPRVDRFAELDELLHAHHPDSPGHDHLAFLAVRGAFQGQGAGSRLLEHHHHGLDQAGRPSYLEATSERAVRLYERHGYRHVCQPFAPPGCPQAQFWPMWRDPNASVPVGASLAS